MTIELEADDTKGISFSALPVEIFRLILDYVEQREPKGLVRMNLVNRFWYRECMQRFCHTIHIHSHLSFLNWITLLRTSKESRVRWYHSRHSKQRGDRQALLGMIGSPKGILSFRPRRASSETHYHLESRDSDEEDFDPLPFPGSLVKGILFLSGTDWLDHHRLSELASLLSWDSSHEKNSIAWLNRHPFQLLRKNLFMGIAHKDDTSMSQTVHLPQIQTIILVDACILPDLGFFINLCPNLRTLIFRGGSKEAELNLLGRLDMGYNMLSFLKLETRWHPHLVLDLSSLNALEQLILKVSPYEIRASHLGETTAEAPRLTGKLCSRLKNMTLSDWSIDESLIREYKSLRSLSLMNIHGVTDWTSVLSQVYELEELDFFPASEDSERGFIEWLNGPSNNEPSLIRHLQAHFLFQTSLQLDLRTFPNLESLFLRKNPRLGSYDDLNHGQSSLKVSSLCQLRTLCLSGWSLSASTLESLFDSSPSSWSRLSSFSLTYCTLLTDAIFPIIAFYLTGLKRLDVSQTQVTRAGMQMFLETMRQRGQTVDAQGNAFQR